MAEDWPASLPQKLNVDGHGYALGDPTLRTNPEIGPPKIRNRVSAVSDFLQGQMYVTTAQMDTLITFYKVTTQAADVFNFPDPTAEDATSPTPTIEVRFAAPPAFAASLKPGVWSCGLSLEIIP